MKTFDTVIITEIGNERDDPTINISNEFLCHVPKEDSSFYSNC